MLAWCVPRLSEVQQGIPDQVPCQISGLQFLECQSLLFLVSYSESQKVDEILQRVVVSC